MTVTTGQLGATRAKLLAEAPVAIRAAGVSKTFHLPHQRYSTIKERVLHPFASSSHDTLRAVDDVSFEIKSGEFYGIVGRNGSGKSTLLKCLAGIYALDAGDIEVHGRLSPFIELGVGFNPDLTARDNVLINAIMLGLSRREARRRFDAIIDFAELHEFVDLKLKNYSSGMSVRLGFSVAIQVDTEVLLVDEVLAVGDASFQRKCFDEFERMRDAGRTIVFVTHDMNAVERFCDRAMLLERGRILETGEPDDISRRYTEVNFGHTAREGGVAAVPEEEVRVRSVWLEDAAGGRTTSIGQGELCTACMEVEFLAPHEHPVFTITFRNEVRHTIFVATSVHHPNAGPFAEGDRVVVRLSFENRLAPNRYALTPAVAVWDPDHRVLVEREDLASLLVEGEVESSGVVYLPTELAVERL